MIPYNTPYGQLMLGIETGRVLVEEQEDQIHVTVEYTLDHEGEPLSESCLKIHIRENRRKINIKIADALMNASIQRTSAIFMCARRHTMGSESLFTLQALLRPFPVP